MNLKEFKESAMDLENYKEKFESFRIWAENYYKLYRKNRELAYMEEVQDYMDPDEFEGSEEEQYFLYDWGMVLLNDAVKLFSELGIRVDNDFEKIPLREDIDGVLYYPQDFTNLYKIVNDQVDDIDFFYGLLILISQIQESQKIYKNYVVDIKKGIKKYGLEICEKEIIGNRKKVFIAIWFNESMEEARKIIIKAIKLCGYEPMIIDIKEHNNQIVPEIFKEIEDSEFVIADLTGHRGGVYYEAGYAMARNKEVILSCKEGESTHFDVAQINTIYWKEEVDLYERLIKRIKATIGTNE